MFLLEIFAKLYVSSENLRKFRKFAILCEIFDKVQFYRNYLKICNSIVNFQKFAILKEMVVIRREIFENF